jgi:hypothetical protein
VAETLNAIAADSKHLYGKMGRIIVQVHKPGEGI